MVETFFRLPFTVFLLSALLTHSEEKVLRLASSDSTSTFTLPKLQLHSLETSLATMDSNKSPLNTPTSPHFTSRRSFFSLTRASSLPSTVTGPRRSGFSSPLPRASQGFFPVQFKEAWWSSTSSHARSDTFTRRIKKASDYHCIPMTEMKQCGRSANSNLYPARGELDSMYVSSEPSKRFATVDEEALLSTPMPNPFDLEEKSSRSSFDSFTSSTAYVAMAALDIDSVPSSPTRIFSWKLSREQSVAEHPKALRPGAKSPISVTVRNKLRACASPLRALPNLPSTGSGSPYLKEEQATESIYRPGSPDSLSGIYNRIHDFPACLAVEIRPFSRGAGVDPELDSDLEKQRARATSASQPSMLEKLLRRERACDFAMNIMPALMAILIFVMIVGLVAGLRARAHRW